MKRTAIGLVALALVLTACQSAAEVLAEQAAEQALGGDVKIDTDSGEVSVETEDGSITIGGGELPDGFSVPFPDGYQVTSVFTSDDGEAVTVAYPGGDFDSIVSFYDDWTDGQSIDWSKTASSIGTEEQSLDSANWTADEGSGLILIRNLCLVADESIDPEECISVSINVGND